MAVVKSRLSLDRGQDDEGVPQGQTVDLGQHSAS